MVAHRTSGRGRGSRPPATRSIPEPVVVVVAVAACDAPVQLDDAVDGLCAAVVGSLGGEVAQVGVLPLPQGPAQAGDLADRAGRERGHDLLGDLLPRGQVSGGVGGADLLVALPGEKDLAVGVAAAQAVDEPVPLAFGEVAGGAVQDVADPEQRVPGVAPVTQGVLLNTAADLVHGLGGGDPHSEVLLAWQ